MLLGIEIGGTKLQFGVGRGDGPPLVELRRLSVQPKEGAEAIRRQIVRTAGPLIEQYGIQGIGIGFGGPVDSAAGRTIVSHQVEGWTDFPLAAWCRQTLGLPTLVANDSDSAGLAEARFGAGRGHSVVVYNNIGSGIGGAIVIDGKLFRGSGGVVAEIGHLRPGPQADRIDQDLEAVASGWAITAAVRARLEDPQGHHPTDAQDLHSRCQGQLDRLDTRLIAEAAAAGNRLAQHVLDQACQTIGWALAQVITLLAPSVVVMGGGVSLAGEQLFFAPLRRYVRQYVFPPLIGTYQIVPAQLGEEVVVYGALALAAEMLGSTDD